MNGTWMRVVMGVAGIWMMALTAGAWDTLPSRADDQPGFQYTPSPADWRRVNMYQIMTDRFNDGDPANNTVNGTFNPTDGFAIHGGDFVGIRQKLDYLQGMGVKSIWISPVQFSVNAYHAYAPTDFNRIETHFGSLQELRELIDDCHSRGIYVIIDIVINHMADLIGSDDSGFPAFKHSGYNMKWWDNNRRHAPPFDRLDRFHNFGEIDNYDDPYKVLKGEFKPGGLDDLKTTDTGVQDDLIRIFKALIDATDCDGFRIDAVKHVEQEFFARFMPAIYEHAAYRGKNNFLIFGESIDGNDNTLSGWTHPNYHFNSMLYFPMYYKMVDVFVHRQRTSLLTERINDLHKYSAASRYQLVNFLDNHDTWRIMYDENLNGDTWRLRPALTFLYTSLQIPCLYYGTEQAFNGGKDPWNREDMFDGGFEWGPSLGDNFNTNSMLYQFIRQLNQFRDAYPALTVGAFAERWQSADGAGIYAYSKTLGAEEVIVALNTHWENRNCQPNAARPNGTVYVNLFDPSDTLTVTGGKLNISLLGHDQKIYAVQRPPLWLGNVRTWPGPTHTQCPGESCNPTLEPDEDLWMDAETRPIRDGQAVTVHYRVAADADWQVITMSWNGNSAEGSFWNASLGAFPAGTTIEYYVKAAETTEEVYANNGGTNFAITVTSKAVVPSALTLIPLTSVNCNPFSIIYHPNDGPLAGASAVYAHLGRNGWNDVVTPTPALTYDSEWNGWRIEVTPEPGTTEINIVFNNGDGVWDNNNSEDWTIAILECDVPFMGLVITNPPAPISVGHHQSTFTLQGLFTNGWGNLRWTNTLNGGSGTMAAAHPWSISNLPLEVGANVITVSGTPSGSGGIATNAHDHAAHYTAWTNGANLGVGFGPWAFESDGGAGHFPGAQGFGFWSHDGGNFSAAARPFPSALTAGQTFHIHMRNGWIWEEGGSVGLALRDTGGDEKWLLYFNGGATHYAGANPTDIPWTDGGLDIAFTLTAANSYLVEITPTGGTTRAYTGSFTGTINNVRVWSFNNGTEDEFNANRDFFVNHLRITGPGGEGALTSAVVTINREAAGGDSNGDRIPDAWYVLYGFNPYGASIALIDSDGDGATNWEEFLADTHPNNPASVYPDRIQVMSGAGVMTLQAGPPTSPQRRYDVYWTTNLAGGVWTPMGLNRPGHADRHAILLSVTNSVPGRFYRTGVGLE